MQSADKDAALDVYDDMRARGMQPTSQCYTSLLAACARAGDLSAARRVFNQMHVTPSVEAYTALMDACLKQKQGSAWNQAFQVCAFRLLQAMLLLQALTALQKCQVPASSTSKQVLGMKRLLWTSNTTCADLH